MAHRQRNLHGRNNVVIWGAGKVGRGFIADLFHAAGHDIVLIDQSSELVDALRKAGRYTVVRAKAPGQRQDVTIEDFEALSTSQAEAVDEAIATCDLAVLAVFPERFPQVAGQLTPAIAARSKMRPNVPLDILVCTNLPHAGPHLRAALQAAVPANTWTQLEGLVGIVETLVIRIVTEPPLEERQRDPLLVWTNGYPHLWVDRRAFRGPLPEIEGLRWVDDMRAEEQRKLFTYNLYQAALAYLGSLRGHATAAEAAADSISSNMARAVLAESSQALQVAHGFSAEDMDAWNRGVIDQTANPYLGDALRRLGADPRRKLRRDDRLVGPALLARQHGLPHSHLVQAIAGALRYQDEQDAGAVHVQQRIAGLGLPGAVGELCGLTEEEADLVEAIVQAYRRLPLELEWAKRAQEAYRLGFEYEQTYHGCGQCTLAAVLDSLDRFDESAFEAATGLAGGLGLAGSDGVCGALMGAVLAFGLVYPRRREHFDGDRANKYRVYAMAQRMRERYMERYGGVSCHDVHRDLFGRTFDLRCSEERQAFEEAGAHDDKCTGVVARAAQWAVEIIGEELAADALAEKGGERRD